jgi:hypothetical protein
VEPPSCEEEEIPELCIGGNIEAVVLRPFPGEEIEVSGPDSMLLARCSAAVFHKA